MESSNTLILIVEDDHDMGELLADIVESEGWTPCIVSSAEDALKIVAEKPYRLALIDHNLPGLSGRSLAQKLRAEHDFGIIMVTAAGSALDRVLGLEMAADDYVVKPFETAELAARMKSVLRRYYPGAKAPVTPAPNLLRLGTWTIDLHTRRATCGSNPKVTLTSSEFALLEILAENPGQPIDRLQILKRLGSNGAIYADRNIDVQVLRLRRKIEPNPDIPQHILTRRGKGYVLVLDNEK